MAIDLLISNSTEVVMTEQDNGEMPELPQPIEQGDEPEPLDASRSEYAGEAPAEDPDRLKVSESTIEEPAIAEPASEPLSETIAPKPPLIRYYRIVSCAPNFPIGTCVACKVRLNWPF